MDAVSKEESRSNSAGSLHNEPTSVWLNDGASTVSSVTKGATSLDESMNLSISELSVPSVPTTEEMLSNSARSGDLHFSKRGSDISDEVQQKMIKPATFMESKRKSERVLPVSKLRFESLGLVGRDEEKAILETRLKTVADGNRELIFIAGEAGTGKTVLALSIKKRTNKLGGLFVKGKFDLYLHDDPYAGFAPVCRAICGRLLQIQENEKEDDTTSERIRNELIEKLGSENLHILVNVIPELSEIVGDEIREDEDLKKQTNEESKARLNYAFRILFRVVASHFAPLVIFLDDIQWSDAATLDLLKVLITDRDNPGLMVIGAYRSNEVDESHILSRLVGELTREADQADFMLTKIEIGNLDTPQINEIIMRLLSIDEPEKTMGLAHICYKRSYGNVFSLLVFLEMLKEEGLLHFNLGEFKWKWNEEKILAETAATANVVDLMRQKIEKLPKHVSQYLLVAACLGFSFDPVILDTIWNTMWRQRGTEEYKGSSEKSDETRDWLDLVEHEGLLEKEPDNTSYRWVHDKVQEAAMSLVPSNELPSLKSQVGSILVSELSDKELDSYIFTVVNLLHEGAISTEDSVELAQLSLKASKKAYELSAFESSGKYSTIGVQALPADRWSNHYELTLDLFSTAAEVAGYLGHTEDMTKYYNDVLEQAQDRPLWDKLRVYHAMMSYQAGAVGGKPQDAVDLIVEILGQLDKPIRFPKRKWSRLVSTIIGAVRAKRKVLSLSLDDIANMPIMDDPLAIEKCRLLEQCFTAAYLAKSDMLPLSVFAGARLTLTSGLSEYSAPLLASLAVFLGVALGDTKSASKAASFSRVAMTKVECKNTNARADMTLHSFVFCWTEPLKNMLSPLSRAYETGLSVGDNENACWCIAQYIVIGFQSGKSLRMLETDCKTYSKQMLEFKRETVYTDICIYTEAIQNLMGLSNGDPHGDPTIMKSDDHFMSREDHTILAVFYSFRSILYMYFGEYEKGAELAIERGDSYQEGIPNHVWIMIETFARGMSLYAMARETRKRVYKKHARHVHKTIKTWLRKGNPNVKHYDLLFNAELAALQRKLDAAEGWYQSAIVCAARNGCIHESALASERYGEFLLLERNDREEAMHKFDDALRRYREWGANKKADMLREKHQDLWEKPDEVVVGVDQPEISKLGFSREFSFSLRHSKRRQTS